VVKEPEVLAVVQARGGSKELPNKNLLPLRSRTAWPARSLPSALRVPSCRPTAKQSPRPPTRTAPKLPFAALLPLLPMTHRTFHCSSTRSTRSRSPTGRLTVYGPSPSRSRLPTTCGGQKPTATWNSSAEHIYFNQDTQELCALAHSAAAGVGMISGRIVRCTTADEQIRQRTERHHQGVALVSGVPTNERNPSRKCGVEDRAKRLVDFGRASKFDCDRFNASSSDCGLNDF
jgi:hypothetical protein